MLSTNNQCESNLDGNPRVLFRRNEIPSSICKQFLSRHVYLSEQKRMSEMLTSNKAQMCYIMGEVARKM